MAEVDRAKVPPRVSVVMAAYNGERFLADAIASILNQTLTDLELIVIDDGSTDGTHRVLRSIEDQRLKVLVQSENVGLTRCLNLGLASSVGCYVARQDCDDVSEPTRLQMQIDFLEANEKLAAVGSAATQIDDDGDAIGILERATDPDEIRVLLETENPFVHGSVMFRKSVLQSVGGYREQFRFAQDYDLFLRLSEHYPLANLTAALYRKRHTESAVSIRYAGLQRQCSDAAIRCHQQRLQGQPDELQAGGDLQLGHSEAGDNKEIYERSLIYMYLRSDQCQKARALLWRSIKADPIQPKHYLQYAVTLLPASFRLSLLGIRDRGTSSQH